MRRKLNKKDKIIMLMATGFGLGRIPMAPGTFGTLAGLPLIWAMSRLSPGASGFFLVCLVLSAVWVADRAETIMGEKDPGAIVIDEMAGYCVTLSLVPVGLISLALGFLGFRVFDILKPGPVRYFEQQYTGGAGIVLDDLMAGVMAALVLKILHTTALF